MDKSKQQLIIIAGFCRLCDRFTDRNFERDIVDAFCHASAAF